MSPSSAEYLGGQRIDTRVKVASGSSVGIEFSVYFLATKNSVMGYYRNDALVRTDHGGGASAGGTPREVNRP